jgi:ribonucleoside-diphosphate reductase beta chain
MIECPDEKKRLFESAKSVPVIRAKADWARRYIADESCDFATRLVAFCCVEQIYFSASFAAIYWVRVHLKKLPGLCQANELIARDEGQHCEWAIHLLNNHIKNRPSTETFHEILRSAAENEKDFVRESLQTDLIGMRSDMMCNYVEYMTDRLCADLNIPSIYETKNPFEQMMRFISTPCKTNFFERHVTEYQRGQMIVEADDDNW